MRFSSVKVQRVIPYKKPKGKELTKMQKQNNTTISKIRVRVEHPFAWLKHFHILRHQFRGRIKQADLSFQNIACLYNFNLAYTTKPAKQAGCGRYKNQSG